MEFNNQRNSLAPTLNRNNFNGISSNTKAYQRNSTLAMTNPRNTTFTMTNKSDPRPITDAKFKNDSANLIFNYLIMNSYDTKMSKKDLMSLTRTEFFKIFFFLLGRFRPDFTQNPDVSADENVLNVLAQLKYPGVIQKHHLSAVGAPNTNQYVLALLVWMVELAFYYDSFKHKNEDYQTKFYPNNDINNDEKFNSYLLTACHSNNIEEIRNQFKKDLEEKIEQNSNEMNTLIQQKEVIMGKITDLQNSINSMSQLTVSLSQTENEFNTIKAQLDSAEKVNADIQDEINVKNNNLANLTEINQKYEKQIKDLTEARDNQKVSSEEYDKMKEKKNALELTIATQTQRRNEWLRKIEELKVQLNNTKLQIIQDHMKTFEKIKTGIEIETLLTQCDNQKIEEVNQFFDKLSSETGTKINTNKISYQEKDKKLAELSSVLLEIEDQISSTSFSITQLDTELSLKQTEIQKNKNQDNNFFENYKDEIQKINDSIQKCITAFTEKESQINSLKKEESELNVVFNNKEAEASAYLKELEDTYKETLTTLEKMKLDNVQLIRKSYKLLDGIFQSIKTELTQNKYNNNSN